MWDQRFSAATFAYGTEPNSFLVEQLDRLRGVAAGSTFRPKVLELAGGEGRNGVWLAQQGFDVTIVDGSRVGLEKAQRLAQERGVAVETVHADLGELEIEAGVWDVIVSIWAHLPRGLRASLHRQAVPGLRRGGLFILEAYTPAQLAFGTGGPRDPELLMTLEALQSELFGLDWLIGREIEREVLEGQYHQGLSAVVQVVGQANANAGSVDR
jgi:hypothetical protein